MNKLEDDGTAQFVTGIVTAYVSNHHVPMDKLSDLIRTVAADLRKVRSDTPDEPEVVEQPSKPSGAVSIRASLASPDKVLSMIDGKPYSSLRRHIRTNGYTEATYKETFGLPRDYPMVAPNYSKSRSALAKELGLGRKPAVPAGNASPAKTISESALAPASASAPVAGASKPRKPRAAAASDRGTSKNANKRAPRSSTAG